MQLFFSDDSCTRASSRCTFGDADVVEVAAGSDPPQDEDGEPGGAPQLTSGGDRPRPHDDTCSWRTDSGTLGSRSSSACDFGCRPDASGWDCGACPAGRGRPLLPDFEQVEERAELVVGGGPAARSSSRAAEQNWACSAWPHSRPSRPCSLGRLSAAAAWPSWMVFGWPLEDYRSGLKPGWTFASEATKASGDEDEGDVLAS